MCDGAEFQSSSALGYSVSSHCTARTGVQIFVSASVPPPLPLSSTQSARPGAEALPSTGGAASCLLHPLITHPSAREKLLRLAIGVN